MSVVYVRCGVPPTVAVYILLYLHTLAVHCGVLCINYCFVYLAYFPPKAKRWLVLRRKYLLGGGHDGSFMCV